MNKRNSKYQKEIEISFAVIYHNLKLIRSNTYVVWRKQPIYIGETIMHRLGHILSGITHRPEEWAFQSILVSVDWKEW